MIWIKIFNYKDLILQTYTTDNLIKFKCKANSIILQNNSIQISKAYKTICVFKMYNHK